MAAAEITGQVMAGPGRDPLFRGDTEFKRVQYPRIVLLNFNGTSWPHITVATLTRP